VQVDDEDMRESLVRLEFMGHSPSGEQTFQSAEKPSVTPSASRGGSARGPRVSVLMAVYNGERYLKAAVESILAQSFEDFEFIIVDDGSTDRSPAQLRNYADRDARIRLISSAKAGLTRSLNKGLAIAAGEFVARMDADDIARPERFAQQVAFLDAHPNTALVGCGYDLIDEKDRVLDTVIPVADDKAIQDRHLRGLTTICHPCMMARHQSLSNIGGYDESYPVAQDLDLYLRLGETGELANLPALLMKYRYHSRSTSDTRQQLQLECMRKATERAWERRGITGTFEVPEHWRPGNDTELLYGFELTVAHRAFCSGQRRTAVIYTLKAVFRRPLRMLAWRLLYHALLKRIPPQVGVRALGSPAL
jgi:glycosyltransferase involved in cell wall biosynthesis